MEALYGLGFNKGNKIGSGHTPTLFEALVNGELSPESFVSGVAPESGFIFVTNADGTESTYGTGLPPSLEKNEGICKDCIDPNTVGKNAYFSNYIGGDNPMTFGRDYTYAAKPRYVAEFAAIGHDRRYDKLRIEGFKGVLTDTRAIGADMLFVLEQAGLANNRFATPWDRYIAGTTGAFIGIVSLPKTIYKLSTINGVIETAAWFLYSNKGVNNVPDIHKH